MRTREVAATLELVATAARRAPATTLPKGLDPLFTWLAACAASPEAADAEEQIWALWMYHPHHHAARELDRATSEIAAKNYDIAETRLARLTRALPRYSEAWHKIATLYYLQERDDECIVALRHVLELEPRHFAAMAALAELLLSEGDFETAQFVFESALRIHPHQHGLRERLAEMNGSKS